MAFVVAHLGRTIVFGCGTIADLCRGHCQALGHAARAEIPLRLFGGTCRLLLRWLWIRSLGRYFVGSCGCRRRFLGFLRVLLTILPLINLLKDAILVHFLELPVELAGIRRVSHDDLVEDELLDDVLVDGVLLELEVVVVDWLALDDLVIVLWIVELL